MNLFQSSIPAKKGKIFLATVAAISTVVAASVAVALTAETTPQVLQTSIEIPYSFDLQENTAWIGAASCKKLVSDNSQVKVTFKTRQNTVLEPRLYDRVLTFEVPRNSTARIDCSNAATLCSVVDNTYITRAADKVVVEIPFSKLTGIKNPADCDTVDKELFLRLQLRALPTDTNFVLADAKFIIDAVGPQAPTLDSVSSTTSTMVVELKSAAGADIDKFAMVASPTPITAGEKLTTQTPVLFGNSKTTRATLNVQLTAGTKYYIALLARDETGNFSPFSNVIEVTPSATKNFWDVYQEAGGADEGGCSSLHDSPVNSTPTFLFIVLGMMTWWQRRRH